jgi:hypothetical protein
MAVGMARDLPAARNHELAGVMNVRLAPGGKVHKANQEMQPACATQHVSVYPTREVVSCVWCLGKSRSERSSAAYNKHGK